MAVPRLRDPWLRRVGAPLAALLVALLAACTTPASDRPSQPEASSVFRSDLATVTGILYRVSQEVHENLSKSIRIGLEHDVRDLLRQRLATLRGTRVHQE